MGSALGAWPVKKEEPAEGLWLEEGPAREVWPRAEDGAETEDWPVRGEWSAQKSPAEGLWLRERVSSAETLTEKQGLVEGAWLVADQLTKVVWSRERGESEERAKPEKPG